MTSIYTTKPDVPKKPAHGLTYKPAKLSLHAYWRAIGTDKLLDVLAEAGISFNYFKQVASLFKSCTPIRFEAIERAAHKITPGICPDYETCTRPSVILPQIEQRLAAKPSSKLELAREVNLPLKARQEHKQAA